jgi:hypothetical protein
MVNCLAPEHAWEFSLVAFVSANNRVFAATI